MCKAVFKLSLPSLLSVTRAGGHGLTGVSIAKTLLASYTSLEMFERKCCDSPPRQRLYTPTSAP